MNNVESWGIRRWTKNLPFPKEGKEQCTKKPGRRIEVFLSAAIPAMDALCACTVTDCLNQGQHDFQSTRLRSRLCCTWSSSGELALIHALLTSLGAIRGLSRAIQGLAINPRTLHTSLGVIWGLCSQSENCYERSGPRFVQGNPWIVLIKTLCITHIYTKETGMHMKNYHQLDNISLNNFLANHRPV